MDDLEAFHPFSRGPRVSGERNGVCGDDSNDGKDSFSLSFYGLRVTSWSLGSGKGQLCNFGRGTLFVSQHDGSSVQFRTRISGNGKWESAVEISCCGRVHSLGISHDIHNNYARLNLPKSCCGHRRTGK